MTFPRPPILDPFDLGNSFVGPVLQYLAGKQVLSFSFGAVLGLIFASLIFYLLFQLERAIDTDWAEVLNRISIRFSALKRFCKFQKVERIVVSAQSFRKERESEYDEAWFDDWFRRNVGANASDFSWKQTRSSDLRRKYLAELGLAIEASIQDIKRAYRRLIKIYHPDKLTGASKAEREAATAKAIKLTEAYDFLIRT